MSDMLICVDALDRQIGSADKLRCHREGLLHRAFSVFLVDGSRFLLQRRALDKYHSGGLWANSCCSHPRLGESLPEAVNRRLFEELGVSCPCQEIGSFVYRHQFSSEPVSYTHLDVYKRQAVICAITSISKLLQGACPLEKFFFGGNPPV